MSKEERIQEIRERLSKGTKGPLLIATSGYAVYSTLEGVPDCADRAIAVMAHNNRERTPEAIGNAQLFAHARADIEFLLSELEPQTVAETIDYVEAAKQFRRHRFDSALERLDSPENDAVWLKSFVQRIHSPAPDTKGLGK